MKIGIIEDEAVHMQILNRYIKNWGVERKENLQIKEYDSAESFLFAWEDEKDFDILFIDIQMKKMDGIKMAKRIREFDNNVALVFTTGVAEYISEGYEVEALHYLIKPLNEQKVVQCLERAIKKKSDTEYIIFRGEDGVFKFDKRKIIYVEAAGHNMVFNPSNASFRQAKNSRIYVDKTELIEHLNERLSTEDKCLAVSHARRFGKSHAAGMIDAYYSLGCDSTELFDGTKISESMDYKKYMNKYNVVHLDIASVWDFHKEDLVESIKERVCDDFKEEFGENLNYHKDLYMIIYDIYKKTNTPFVIIIDEWDCVIRNSDDSELVHMYLQFLHSLFKSEESKSFLALAYITGILPIKKIKDESALNNFSEYTMLKSKPITQYFGFTEDEVKELCEKFDMDFETTKAWYNGYLIDGMHMYNPNSVSMAMRQQDFDSYWKNTSSFASINTFITMNYTGLKDDIMTMVSGGKVMVETDGFQNDLSEIHSKDDAITALIHLGYLGYDADEQSAYVPNYEVAKAFQLALKTGVWADISKAISRCNELLMATIKKDEDKVAEIIELAHDTYTSVIKYNKSADTAIRQIKEKRYHGELSGYSDKILLIGISYDADGKDAKHHTCVIEEINV